MKSFFDWNLVISYFPQVLSALPITILVVTIASIIGLLLGAIIGFIRIERIKVLDQMAGLYVSFIRGTPILVQLYLVYYGIPAVLAVIGIDASQWNKLYFLYITYGLNTAAFQSETIRAAFLSVPRLQKEAAIACGLTKRQTYMKIIIPQAIRVAIPSFATITISLLQDTSLAFTIGVIDVVGKAKAIGTSSFHTMEGYVDAAIIFIVLSFVLEKAFALFEKKVDAIYAPLPVQKATFLPFIHHKTDTQKAPAELPDKAVKPQFKGDPRHAEKV